MEGRRKPLQLDWAQLLGVEEEGPEPELVVTTATATIDGAAAMDVDDQPESSETGGSGGEEGSNQRDRVRMLGDSELNEAINRQIANLEKLSGKLKDKGEKLRAYLRVLQCERERRKRVRSSQDISGVHKLTQSSGLTFVGASDSSRQGAPTSLHYSQSSFASHFCRKMEAENADCKELTAFEKELSYFKPCERGKTGFKKQFSPRGRQKSGLSSRKIPFQSPRSISFDFDTGMLPNGVRNGRNSPSCSPHVVEEDMSCHFQEKQDNVQVEPSRNLRLRKGHTVVLVDEEEPELVEMTEQADKMDECFKDMKIYYPSRGDPGSIEISYSDLECLKPEAFLSSNIMNFYIQYLQQTMLSTDRAICDYQFFNTYFYEKLKEAMKKESDMEAFAKFRRWWKGVNIFEKAYMFLPIHENLHWSLAIICIPDKEEESGPIILHLDSLKLHCSRSIFYNIKSFLKAEWNYLKQEAATVNLPIADKIWQNLSRRIDVKIIPVPQQKNDYDCGFFVLFFMERFIEQAPGRLKNKDLEMFGRQWFKPEEASGLRRKILRILRNEFRNATDSPLF